MTSNVKDSDIAIPPDTELESVGMEAVKLLFVVIHGLWPMKEMSEEDQQTVAFSVFQAAIATLDEGPRALFREQIAQQDYRLPGFILEWQRMWRGLPTEKEEQGEAPERINCSIDAAAFLLQQGRECVGRVLDGMTATGVN